MSSPLLTSPDLPQLMPLPALCLLINWQLPVKRPSQAPAGPLAHVSTINNKHMYSAYYVPGTLRVISGVRYYYYRDEETEAQRK